MPTHPSSKGHANSSKSGTGRSGNSEREMDMKGGDAATQKKSTKSSGKKSSGKFGG